MRITETITPERASEILATYEYGNKVDRSKVEKYKQKILSGRWRPDNGFFINIRGGKLVNGKHRLTALMESGLTLQMRIQYDR